MLANIALSTTKSSSHFFFAFYGRNLPNENNKKNEKIFSIKRLLVYLLLIVFIFT